MNMQLPAMCREPLRWMPSGVQPGTVGRPLHEELLERGMLPPCFEPVLEEGSYTAIKDCVFRVLSVAVCNAAIRDIKSEFDALRVECSSDARRWVYVIEPTAQSRVDGIKACATVVHLHLSAQGFPDLSGYLTSMAAEYGFTVNSAHLNHARNVEWTEGYRAGNGAVVQLDRGSSITATVEIVWPYWT